MTILNGIKDITGLYNTKVRDDYVMLYEFLPVYLCNCDVCIYYNTRNSVKVFFYYT